MKNIVWFCLVALFGSAITHYGFDIYQYFLIAMGVLLQEAQNIDQNTNYNRGLGLMLPILFASSRKLCIMELRRRKIANN